MITVAALLAAAFYAGVAWRGDNGHGEYSHVHALSKVGSLQGNPNLPRCHDTAGWPKPGWPKGWVELRLTAWGRCHWVWQNEHIGTSVQKTRSYGPTRSAQHALARLGSSAHLVDIGANVGLVTAAALAIGHNTTSVEGDWENAALLRATLALNGWHDAALVNRAVVADAVATPTVSFSRSSSKNRGSGELVADKARARNAESVRAVSLDGLLSSGHIPSHVPLVLKLDIQGCEHAALRGGPAVLSRTQVVLIELQAAGRMNQKCGGSAEEIIDLLRRSGFSRVYADSGFGGGARALSWSAVQRRVQQTKVHFDVIFVRASVRM